MGQEVNYIRPSTSLKRKQELLGGRTCARQALELLGCPRSEILQGPNREPQWPKGYVGSITHSNRYCGAAAARDKDFASVGIDAEENSPLPAEVVSMITTPAERAHIARLPSHNWGTLIFSAKESLYKTIFPLAKLQLDFHDATITFTCNGLFTASLQVPIRGLPCVFRGRYYMDEEIFLTAVVLSTLC